MSRLKAVVHRASNATDHLVFTCETWLELATSFSATIVPKDPLAPLDRQLSRRAKSRHLAEIEGRAPRRLTSPEERREVLA